MRQHTPGPHLSHGEHPWPRLSRRSITRRSLVAGSAALAALPGAPTGSAPDFAFTSASASANASSGLRSETPDPIHAAIAAHARAYAACAAYQDAEPDDEVGLEPLLHAERAAAEAFAATVPATLEGVAAALAHVHLLDSRDNYPALDDYWCYVLIASADTALQRMLECRAE